MSRNGKRADMIGHEEEQFNAETATAASAEAPLTASDVFYARCHAAVSEIDPRPDAAGQ